MLTFVLVTTSIPIPALLYSLYCNAALSNIVAYGAFIDSNKITSPSFSGTTANDASNKATPPPATIPSCNAALVAVSYTHLTLPTILLV